MIQDILPSPWRKDLSEKFQENKKLQFKRLM